MVDEEAARRTYNGAKAVALFAVFAVTVPLFAKDGSERFTGFVVDMTTRAVGRPTKFEVALDAWSTEGDREALAIAGDADGMAGVMKLLSDSRRIGYVRIGSRLGTEVTYARQIGRSNGSRRIVIVIARDLSFGKSHTDHRLSNIR